MKITSANGFNSNKNRLNCLLSGWIQQRLKAFEQKKVCLSSLPLWGSRMLTTTLFFMVTIARVSELH